MPYSTEIDVRYRDLDTLAHVNNAVIATYVEQGRVGYLDRVFEAGLEEYAFVIAHLEIDFERRIEIDDSVEVTVEVPELGTSSVPMRYRITADGERAATAETTLVFLDEAHEDTAPIPEEIRERVDL